MGKLAFASAESTAAAQLLDEQLRTELATSLEDVLAHALGNDKFAKLQAHIPEISRALHSVCSLVINWRSVGEEQLGIATIDVGLLRIAPWWKRLLFACLENIPMPRKGLITVLASMVKAAYWLRFAVDEGHPNLAMQLLGLRRIFYPPPVRPLQVQKAPFDRLLVISIACRVVFAAYSEAKVYIESFHSSNIPMVSSKLLKCPLCLSRRENTVVLRCGHAMCWRCLAAWISSTTQPASNSEPHKTVIGECPLCRSQGDLNSIYVVGNL
jgi:hypothetical protein